MFETSLKKTPLTKCVAAAAILAMHQLLCGFVLLGSNKATLDVTPESPTVTLVWNGSSPSEIEEKENFQNGAYQDLDDEAFMLQLLQEAARIWNEVPGSYLDIQVAQGEVEADTEDLVHAIVVEESSNATTAAFAKPQYNEDNPEIIEDCDIVISDSSVTAKSLAYTVAHELGHCIGLGHPHTNYGAMMGYSRGARDLRLGADDMAGIIFLYPNPAYVDGEPTELINCGTVGPKPSPARGWGLLGFLLLGWVPAVYISRLGRR